MIEFILHLAMCCALGYLCCVGFYGEWLWFLKQANSHGAGVES